MRVGLFGDWGTDIYWVGRVHGLSAEAPIPVLKDAYCVVLPGMAGNVASLFGKLGVEVVSVYGDTPRQLPIKNRLVTQDGVQLARWDCQDTCTPPTEIELLSMDLGSLDAFVVCDYGKGGVTDDVIRFIQLNSKIFDLPIFVDTKSDPIAWLGSRCILTPNHEEYLRYKSSYDWLSVVLHKMSGDGIEYLAWGRSICHHRAEAINVRNVCGAGDAVLAAATRAYLEDKGPEKLLEYVSWRAANYVESLWSERDVI